ncbi:hypothetical protein DIPPA_31760, partial [Diplonema papillatum]
MRCSIVVAVLVFGITGVCQPEAGARRIPYETDNSTRRTRDDQGDEQRNLKPPRDYNTTSHHPAPTSPALCNNAAVEKRAPGVAIAVYPLSGGQYEPPGRRDNATRRHPTLTTPALCNNAAVEKRAPGVAIAVYPPSGGQYKPPGRRDNATRRHPALATPAQCNSAAVEKRASGTAVANTMSNEDDGNEQRDRPRGDDAHAEPVRDWVPPERPTSVTSTEAHNTNPRRPRSQPRRPAPTPLYLAPRCVLLRSVTRGQRRVLREYDRKLAQRRARREESDHIAECVRLAAQLMALVRATGDTTAQHSAHTSVPPYFSLENYVDTRAADGRAEQAAVPADYQTTVPDNAITTPREEPVTAEPRGPAATPPAPGRPRATTQKAELTNLLPTTPTPHTKPVTVHGIDGTHSTPAERKDGERGSGNRGRQRRKDAPPEQPAGQVASDAQQTPTPADAGSHEPETHAQPRTTLQHTAKETYTVLICDPGGKRVIHAVTGKDTLARVYERLGLPPTVWASTTGRLRPLEADKTLSENGIVACSP